MRQAIELPIKPAPMTTTSARSIRSPLLIGSKKRRGLSILASPESHAPGGAGHAYHLLWLRIRVEVTVPRNDKCLGHHEHDGGADAVAEDRPRNVDRVDNASFAHVDDITPHGIKHQLSTASFDRVKDRLGLRSGVF